MSGGYRVEHQAGLVTVRCLGCAALVLARPDRPGQLDDVDPLLSATVGHRCSVRFPDDIQGNEHVQD